MRAKAGHFEDSAVCCGVAGPSCGGGKVRCGVAPSLSPPALPTTRSSRLGTDFGQDSPEPFQSELAGGGKPALDHSAGRLLRSAVARSVAEQAKPARS